MYTLLDTCLDRLDIFEFLSHVEDGLKDHYDIKVCTAVTIPPYVEPKRNDSLQFFGRCQGNYWVSLEGNEETFDHL